ncbi:STAS domain-containing protein [Guptibacillus algicola]|uniref:STAS domain-containing protein n=1 Tax=Guptibacillus algicola TaxID=225844 RepID=UPI001CD344F6|nr:STAS domain-containing protein [Alkalihalobacillus algicola]MCA0987546.1 STAS domain-containing protein [Alkalihalobacillus algicola]
MVRAGREPLIIDDLTTNSFTKDMDVTKSLGGGSLVGVPINFRNGENFGTLCAMDSRPHHFEDDHIALMKSMASLLGNVLELEKAHSSIETLSVPLVPISSEVAILPIIGDVDEERTERIIETALSQSVKKNLEYILLDLSGLHDIDENNMNNLLKISKSLDLVGVQMIITGIRPQLAMKAVQSNSDFEHIEVSANLSQALDYIGYQLIKNDD